MLVKETAKNYSITELEMCGLAINITSFAYLLERVDFDAIVDHLAIMHLMKSKMEPTMNRINRLLELLSSYTLNLYFMLTFGFIYYLYMYYMSIMGTCYEYLS